MRITPPSKQPTDLRIASPDLSEHDIARLEQRLGGLLRRASRPRFSYMVLQSLALALIAVVLFINARYYSSMSLWAMGVCLLVFCLVDLLELDYLRSGYSFLDVFAQRSHKDETDGES
jgi:hypothetical protein